MSKIKKVVGVVSGKGGVGKSSVTAMLSVILRRRDLEIGIMDADITGPSIPKMFGVYDPITGDDTALLPASSKTGIKMVSANLLLPDEKQPVIWRGAMISSLVTQFWTDVVWGDLDVLFIDMPPGTGDVPLTVFQSMPLDGIIIVTSPQDLVSMIVAKAVNMANKMNVPVLGIVENYSYLTCPDCGKKVFVFGESKIEDVAKEFNLPVLAQLPIDNNFAKQCDNGTVELFEGVDLESAADLIESL